MVNIFQVPSFNTYSLFEIKKFEMWGSKSLYKYSEKWILMILLSLSFHWSKTQRQIPIQNRQLGDWMTRGISDMAPVELLITRSSAHSQPRLVGTEILYSLSDLVISVKGLMILAH